MTIACGCSSTTRLPGTSLRSDRLAAVASRDSFARVGHGLRAPQNPHNLGVGMGFPTSYPQAKRHNTSAIPGSTATATAAT